MTRHHRALVLGAALGTILFSAAPAAAEEFVFITPSGAASTTLSGVQHSEKDVFTTAVGTVECDEASYTGTLVEGQATQVDLEPTYAKCLSEGLNVTFASNGCDYRFKAGTIESGNYEGSADIVCPVGQQMEAKVMVFGFAVCTVKFPAQSGLDPITFTTIEKGHQSEVTADADVEGQISHTYSGSGCSSGSSSTGSYHGAGLVKGTVGGAAAGLLAMRPPPHGVVRPNPLEIQGATGIRTGFLWFVDEGKWVIDEQTMPATAPFDFESKSKSDGGCGGTIEITGAPKGCAVVVKSKSAAVGAWTTMTTKWHEWATPTKIESRFTTVERVS